MNSRITDVFQGIDGYRHGLGHAAVPNSASQGGFQFIDSLERQVRQRSAARDTPIAEHSIVGKLRSSQDHYDDVREKRKLEYLAYLDEEIKLKKAQKEVEDEKLKQKELYQEQKFKNEQDLLRRRYEDEQRREMAIDYGLVAKNREKFEQVFLQRGAANKTQPDEKKEKQKNDDQEGGSGEGKPEENQPTDNANTNFEEVFDAEAIFRRKKPAYSMENSRQEKPYFETSFASNELDPQAKARQVDNDSDYHNDLQEIKRQQQRNIMNQMELDKDYRPHVINGAPIQGYGLNRNKQASFDNLVQYEHQMDQQSALERYEQAKREHYKGINKEDILPFLPTTKQIMENQAIRDVKGEMLMMRGHILTNFQKMKSDMDSIKEDVAKGNTRFKYAQAEFQDSLKREMANRDNQMIDVLDHIRQWNPNQAVHPQDHQYSQKHLSKVPDFYIPQLNFESVTNELRQRLEELKNPHVFRNTAARKLEEYNSRANVMVNPNQYVRPDELRNGGFFVNPQSKYLDEVMEEERYKADLERGQRLKHMAQDRTDTGKYSNHSDQNKKIDGNSGPSHGHEIQAKHEKTNPHGDLSANYSNEFIFESGGKDSHHGDKNNTSHQQKPDSVSGHQQSKHNLEDSKKGVAHNTDANRTNDSKQSIPGIDHAKQDVPQDDSREVIEDEDGGFLEEEEGEGEEDEY